MSDIITELTKIGVDTSGALPRFCDSTEMFLKYIFKLPEDQYIPDYKREFQAGNYDAAEVYIHEFKGVSGSLGVTRLYQIASDIMVLLRQKKYEDIAPKNEELYAEYSRISSEIIRCREMAG